METKGTTPLYRKQLHESEIIDICKHLVENNGIRSIGRITGHHKDTICRLLECMARTCGSDECVSYKEPWAYDIRIR